MTTFHAAFKIIEDHNCPLYDFGEHFILQGQAVKFSVGRATCLILARELTGVLLNLLPHIQSEFAEYRKTVFDCGGCTGLIKFSLIKDTSSEITDQRAAGKKHDGSESVMSGNIDAIQPAELLQVFHMHQKTGRLIMELEGGPARVTFREGALLAARFNDLDNQQAIHAILGQKKGRFDFIPGLPESLMKVREIGDFMMILMEGLKLMDEQG